MDWNSIAEIISALGNVGKSGAGILSAFEKQDYPPGYAEAMQSQSDARTYLAASADPSSPYFRNIAETEEQRSRGDLIASVDQIMRQLASRSATGRSTINPERKDEMVWGVLAKGFQEAGMRARETARQNLLKMSGASSSMADNYKYPMAVAAGVNADNRKSRLTGLSGAFDTAIRSGDAIKQGTKEKGKSSVPDWWDNKWNAGYP